MHDGLYGAYLNSEQLAFRLQLHPRQAGIAPSRSYWRSRLPQSGRHQRLAILCRYFAWPIRLPTLSITQLARNKQTELNHEF
jgi:hypothetical protein